MTPTSRHTGIVQVGMADGSVRFISQNISIKTYCNLHGKDDGNPLGDF